MTEKPQLKHYGEILEQLKTYFPVPVSNPIMDGYFVHTISNFLDYVDKLKSTAPLLGGQQKIHYELSFKERFPEKMSSVEQVIKLLVNYCQGTMICAHPNTQVNVIPPSTIPSITATIAGAIYNPNIISDEYSAYFAEAEIQSIAMVSDLIGYDPELAGGFFTFGGTGTILYGCKLAIEKLFEGKAMKEGIREDIKIVASELSHYSRLNVAGWLGVGTDNLIAIPTTSDNQMSLIALEEYLRRAFESGEKVAAILATLGTTDAFGLDDLAGIVTLRNNLAKEFNLKHPPHIHADAVIGWAWLVFKDYDFANNPLCFEAQTLQAIQLSLKYISSLNLADSLGIDFHKTGYAPYICSAFLTKNRNDLSLISRKPQQMPYLYQWGQYHPGIYTLESSRQGSTALAALANIRLLGKEGYRVLIGHIVAMAQILRRKLENYSFIQVLNANNYGPVTLFRVYPKNINALEEFQRELKDPGYQKQLLEYNHYNRCLFDCIHERTMRGQGVLLSWTDLYQHTDYSKNTSISAFKSFIISPWTDLKALDLVVEQIVLGCQEVCCV